MKIQTKSLQNPLCTDHDRNRLAFLHLRNRGGRWPRGQDGLLSPNLLPDKPPSPAPRYPPPTVRPSYLLGDGSDVNEAFPEDHEHAAGPAAQGRGGAVEGRVPRPEHDHDAADGRQRRAAGAHPWARRRKSVGESTAAGQRRMLARRPGNGASPSNGPASSEGCCVLIFKIGSWPGRWGSGGERPPMTRAVTV